MRKFRNRLSLVIGFPLYLVATVALIVRGDSDCREPMEVWRQDIREGN